MSALGFLPLPLVGPDNTGAVEELRQELVGVLGHALGDRTRKDNVAFAQECEAQGLAFFFEFQVIEWRRRLAIPRRYCDYREPRKFRYRNLRSDKARAYPHISFGLYPNRGAA